MTELAHSPTRAVAEIGGLQPRPRPVYVAAPAATFLAVAVAGMLNEIEPFVSFFYICAWYPTILLLDSAIAARKGEYYMLTRPRFALSLLGWSAVLWFLFEVINFRVQNWYYVALPPAQPVRWIGTTVSFATVLPAIFLAEWLLRSHGFFARDRWPTFSLSPALLRSLFAAGLAFVALSLIWPRLFFPLIWGSLTLLLEPWNYRSDPDRSLVGDLASGRPGRLLRLLVAGLAIGVVWELYNIEARAKWIYTVPGFESLKLFEMPLLGFLGFPVFALDCFVVYQSLVLAGVAVSVPRSQGAHRSRPRLRPLRTAVAALAAALFSVGALLGMDRWNTDSVALRLENLRVGAPDERARLARTPYGDPYKLVGARAEDVAAAAGVETSTAQSWVEITRMAALRGIGFRNAWFLWDVGVRSVNDLAAASPEALSRRLRQRADTPHFATVPKVRVWVEAARRASSFESH